MALLQLLLNGIIAGSIYALIAASFSLIFNIVKFMDLSPGATFVVAAFSAYSFHILLSIPFILAILLALVVTVITALLINLLVYKPLRKRGADPFTLLLSSFGVFLTVTGIILLIFGAEIHTFGLPIAKGYDLFGAIITPLQVWLVIISVLLFVVLFFFMKTTKLGKAMRAVADEKQVAATLGINVEKTTTKTFVISAILAGIAGILVGLEQNIEHNMGFAVILKGITASVVGGIGNVSAALLGGFLIGIVENVGIWYLPSGYKDGIAFVILILFLLLRPQGILGTRTREETSG
tara:strand:- start:75829 stop:76710 length:882 start_codon:yes stop_codon:yes gene_type:complete